MELELEEGEEVESKSLPPAESSLVDDLEGSLSVHPLTTLGGAPLTDFEGASPTDIDISLIECPPGIASGSSATGLGIGRDERSWFKYPNSGGNFFTGIDCTSQVGGALISTQCCHGYDNVVIWIRELF